MTKKTVTFFTCCGLEDPCGLGRNFPFAKALANKGIHVHYLALHPHFKSVEQKNFVKDGVNVYFIGQMHVKKIGDKKIDLHPLHLLWVSFSSSLKMFFRGMRIRSHYLFCFQAQPINGFAVLLVKFFTRKPLVLDCQDYEADVNRLSPFQRNIFTWLEDKLLPQAASFITYHNDFLKERYLKLGYNDAKFTFIPNGIDLDRFKDINTNGIKELKQKLKLAKKKVVLYFGTLSLKSGHHVDLLLEAFSLVKKNNPDACLVIVGTGEDIDKLKTMVTEDIKDSVHFTGRVDPDAIPYYIKCADVSVDPMKDTPANAGRSPLKIFESMAMSVPVVTCDTGVRKQTIEENRGGVLVKIGDAQDLARGILSIINNPLEAQRIAQECRRLIQQYYWHNIIQRLEEQRPELFNGT